MPSGLDAWLEDVREVMADDPRHGLLLAAYYLYVGLNLTVTSRYPVGTPVFERDWDVLVVLDACRVDAMRAVADEFDFIGEVDSIRSVGSTSGEWMAHTFDRSHEEAIAETAMVTSNMHSDQVLRKHNSPPQFVAAPLVWPEWDPVEPDTFHRLEEIWDHGWEEDLGTVPPRTVTDRAIAIGRNGDHERLLVHYLQPHAPYLERGPTGGYSAVIQEPLESLRTGELGKEHVWEAYLTNLRLALSEVELLLENLDADRVVLTADHGEAFGEAGFYEHPVACPHPVVKRVPWVETTATDLGEYHPRTELMETETDVEVRDQLEALGYV